MTIERIVEYVLHTPYNTNKAILRSMLEDLIRDNSNNDCSGCDHPDCPNNPNNPDTSETIYDGGDVNSSGGDKDNDGISDLIYDGGTEV